jgi:uncharacterized protein YutE (UPF0331/DUF86 family)
MGNYNQKLELIEECLKRLLEIKKDNQSLSQYRSSWKDKDAAERNLQKIMEAIIDTGKMLISEKQLREPATYKEVFLILNDNGFLPGELLPLIHKMIGMRNILVHSYDRIDDAIVYSVLQRNLSDIRVIAELLKKASMGSIKQCGDSEGIKG